MKVSKNCFLIVDAYSTGQYLAPAYRSFGFPCLHLQSTPEIHPIYRNTFQPGDFSQCLRWEDSIETLRKQIAPVHLLGIIPGCEMGVLLADRLNAELGLPTANDYALSAARRDKYLMAEAVRAAGVRAVRQTKAENIQTVFEWLQAGRVAYPIVLKPIKSAGTDGVHICHDEADVRSAFAAILGQRDLFFHRNSEVLAQEFLHGQEYAVNTVSRDGFHFVSEIMEAHKSIRDGAPIYDFSDMVSPEDRSPLFAELSAYASNVLDALGIRHGAAHAEIMMTPGGPVLIEVGARLNGGIDPSAYTAALGYSQVSLLVESYLHPECFAQRRHQPRAAARHRLRVTFFVCDRGGTIKRRPRLEALVARPSLHSVALADIGELVRTNSFVTSPGYANLVHSDPAVVAQDYEWVRQHEQALFKEML